MLDSLEREIVSKDTAGRLGRNDGDDIEECSDEDPSFTSDTESVAGKDNDDAYFFDDEVYLDNDVNDVDGDDGEHVDSDDGDDSECVDSDDGDDAYFFDDELYLDNDVNDVDDDDGEYVDSDDGDDSECVDSDDGDDGDDVHSDDGDDN